ncbi:4Fe-4S binding protein [Paraliomyxa miuraensis]|uniref:4Fe-4S binding protein n=1 Tax=Paraliomyxa miuraensis TaxID=376150 RepID=UPI002256A8E3|nr:4Fe-4S binding protein [Paraliomyxa miuraensis]MCX4241923.1 4Fe-4S binding protein [Paraliomyxa miuraensis]
MSRRLPVLGQSAPAPDDDPLTLLRGGRFARAFVVVLALVGLSWIASEEVAARDHASAILKVHLALAEPPGPEQGAGEGAGEVPPMPEIEDITPERPSEGEVPPMPAVEDITPEVPPMPAVESIDGVDRFGTKRTKTGALVLEGEGDVEVGLDPRVYDAFDRGGFFDPDKFQDARTVKTKAYVHLMPGIPNEVFYAASALILLLSFVLLERRGGPRDSRSRARNHWYFELTRWRWLDRAIKSRWFQPAFQIPVVLVFLAVIVIGLVGSQEPGRNLAPVLTWNIWWIGLIFLVLFLGNTWCFLCPWTAIPDWIMRRSLTSTRPVASLRRKYPRLTLWMWPAIVMFALVTWLEIVYDAANRPWLTSMLAIGMVVLSWVLLVVYERKAMCRYVCFVGRVSGQYSLMGMLELRRRDSELCRKGCKTRDCFHGREGVGLPCPTHEFMGAMNENQYCTLCTECVKSCPHDNIGLRVRSSGADLLQPHRARRDEAYLALLVFVVSAFHGAAMVPVWRESETALRGWLIDQQAAWLGGDPLGLGGTHGGTITFTLMMGACIVVPGLLYWLMCAAMRGASGRSDVGRRTLFVKLAHTLLPIALFYHLAHNATHVFYEWSKLRRLVSDPLGWGHDLFGTARAPLSALWSPESIWYLQVALVIIGHVYGIVVAQREVSRLYAGDRRASVRVHLVMMVGMIAMSLLSLWLLAQPMYMRTADL